MPRTYQCWDCGRTVGEGEVRRHNVTTWGIRRASTRRVNLCPTCDEKHRRRDRIWNAVGLLIVAVIAVGIVIVFVLPRFSQGG